MNKVKKERKATGPKSMDTLYKIKEAFEGINKNYKDNIGNRVRPGTYSIPVKLLVKLDSGKL